MTDHDSSKRSDSNRTKASPAKHAHRDVQLKVIGNGGESRDRFGTVFLTIILSIKHLADYRTLRELGAMFLIIHTVSSCNKPEASFTRPSQLDEKTQSAGG